LFNATSFKASDCLGFLRKEEVKMTTEAQKLHQEAIVIDAACPLARFGNFFEKWISGGATVIAVTADYRGELMGTTMSRLGTLFRTLQKYPDKLLYVTSVEDIYRAKQENKLGILFHFQDTLAFEKDINNIEVYYRLGVRIVQLCYNTKNFVGDGCAERTDCGLSEFGLKVIAEMNRLGIVVDCAHTGYRTSMEAIEASQKPVIVSHGNAKAVCDSFRNLRDDLIKAVAAKGGVIGITGFPPFVAEKAKSTLDDLLKHVDYIAKLVGVEHISLGIDYWEFMGGVVDNSKAKARYDELIQAGLWNPRDYPPPPYNYPQGIEMPDKLPNLTTGLLNRGYCENDIKNILGHNLIRVFKEVWG
jgi:membrane dipeptidase